MLPIFTIEDQKILIIGDSAIGQATEKLLSSAGATAEIFSGGTDEQAMMDGFANFLAKHGRLDAMIYAESSVGTYPLTEMTTAQWDHMQQVNLRGGFIAIRQTVREMQQSGGGTIVAISTMGALHPVLHGNAAYGSSKAGLNALVRSAALDHQKDGIRVNAVLHGAVPVGGANTESISLGGPATQPGRLLQGMGDLEDVAAAVLYLISPAGKFITGQNLTLDGGFLIA